MFAIQYDWTVNVPTLVAVVGGLLAVGKWALDFRDEQKDLRRIVGHEGPPKGPSGLVKSVLGLRDDVDEQYLTLLSAGLIGDRREPERRHRKEQA